LPAQQAAAVDSRLHERHASVAYAAQTQQADYSPLFAQAHVLRWRFVHTQHTELNCSRQ
jgi:hypothetical protein